MAKADSSTPGISQLYSFEGDAEGEALEKLDAFLKKSGSKVLRSLRRQLKHSSGRIDLIVTVATVHSGCAYLPSPPPHRRKKKSK